MGQFTTSPATADRWADVQHALTGGGDGGRCWCQFWLLPGEEYRDTDRDGLKRSLHRQLVDGPPRAVLAYDGDEAVGWCRVAPRAEQPRLARTRLVQAGGRPVGEDGVWAITCLVVRRSHRGQGVAGVLVDAAVELARTAGARVIEAYPEDTMGEKRFSNNLYVGTTTLFARAGFAEVARPKPRRAVMELVLA